MSDTRQIRNFGRAGAGLSEYVSFGSLLICAVVDVTVVDGSLDDYAAPECGEHRVTFVAP
ncbi:hypothetical protein PAXRUDRAFT_19287 [Paxillus rubicundulus Ve08.2h10]|uniref:Uncharacterized protein n=1 Tax=Paxillus rubicundulus Ve08.2h10 TaxID=930991 RepID=A0A0D0DCL1_9AGAM|nr:hypothetical protein PAXRUDRAFT_19287 [Paxillus rubicundulus Ve08.2h10]